MKPHLKKPQWYEELGKEDSRDLGQTTAESKALQETMCLLFAKFKAITWDDVQRSGNDSCRLEPTSF